MRRLFYVAALFSVLLIGTLAIFWPPVLWSLVVIGPLLLLGLYDVLQRRRSVLRNFPLIGHFRYLFEAIRPEIQQYFIESETSGLPFSREQRSVIYQRAKDTIDTRPFGTVRDLYADGTEWIAHSLAPEEPQSKEPRIPIGEGRCAQPYSASILNVSAMSFGSLSNNAVLALNGGAKLGGFAHNTGEGGISPHHLAEGGDLVWQIGTGYFGCRTPDGSFDRELFRERAGLEAVKMIEVKLSQGAKPGHGGILPGAKVTPEIAAIRGVPVGEDVISPSFHKAFGTPRELVEFLSMLRELSGGKPVGFKLCVGRTAELMGICKAMLESGQMPDFITVDGAEGGTGAAPMEFSNAIGVPLTEGLLVVHNALRGCGLRDQVKVIGSGKVVTGFNAVQRIAIGADLCNSARPMMFALGCIQALRCNTNHCPVGVATQNPDLAGGLDVADKRQRVYMYHRNTVESVQEILGAAGLTHPDQLRPEHIYRRVSSTEIRTYEEVYEYLDDGDLLGDKLSRMGGPYDKWFAEHWAQANADRF